MNAMRRACPASASRRGKARVSSLMPATAPALPGCPSQRPVPLRAKPCPRRGKRAKGLLSPACLNRMSKRIVITGGAGFIGSALARALVARGDDVLVLDNFSSGKRENLKDVSTGLAVVEGDILDASVLDRAFAGADVVFHEAAIPSVPRSLAAPLASHNANATGTLNVLEAARRCQVRRVVYAGSSSAYGEPPSLPVVESMAPAPLSPYAASKLAGEHYCRVYARVFGVQAVILRYFNVFGPRQDPNSQYAAVIPRFITAALQGQPATVF